MNGFIFLQVKTVSVFYKFRSGHMIFLFIRIFRYPKKDQQLDILEFKFMFWYSDKICFNKKYSTLYSHESISKTIS